MAVVYGYSKTTDLELVVRSLCRNIHVETTGSPRFLGNPNIHLHMFFDPGRTNTQGAV